VKPRQNFVIFLLFFGIALIEAFQSKNWLLAFLFILLGAMFLRADNVKKGK
jgi:amino acid transporter